MRIQKRTVFMAMVVCVLLCCSLAAFGAAGSAEPAAAPASAAPAAAPAAAAPAASPTAAEVSSRVDDIQNELERLRTEVGEIERLRNEVLELRKQLATPQPVTSAALVENAQAAAQPQGAAPAAAAAAPATPPPSAMATALGAINMTGFFDGYYAYTFGHPAANVPSTTFGNPTTFPLATTGFSGAPAPLASGLRAFEGPDRQFGFNLAELIINKTPDADNRLGFNFAFGFGNAMNVVNTTEPGTLAFSQYLKEGYLSYNAPIGKGLAIDFGKFVTSNGAEVIETMNNWNYTHSILFTYAIPFYHYGARAKYTFNDKVNLTGYLVNGWNNIVENNTGKTFGLSLGVNPTKTVTITQNYYAGPEQPGITHSAGSHWRQLSDTVVLWNATPKLSLMVNGDYGRDHPLVVARPSWWAGVAGYAKYQIDPKWAAIARYEYYDDHAGFTTGAAAHYHEFTATLERKISGNLITRWEYRYDLSNRNVFAENFTPERHQSQVVGGLIYTFDFKDLK